MSPAVLPVSLERVPAAAWVAVLDALLGRSSWRGKLCA